MTQLDTRQAVASNESPSIPRTVDVIVRAFEDDPPSRWLWPDLGAYREHFPAFVHAFGGPAFAQGTAFHIADYAGAALWLPPGIHPDDDALAALLERSVPPTLLAEAFEVFGQMGAYHPREPHWHLPLIAVAPEQQGYGYGSALLHAVLEQCDRDRLPAYLEATSRHNVRLYERHGFEAVGSIAAGPATIIPMVRRPRGAGS